jgi:hypothetical protein
MTQHNAPVIKMITDRFSAHVKAFNHLPVSTEDSDTHHDLSMERAALAVAAFTRAPVFKPTGPRRALLPAADLGDAYRVMRHHLTPQEAARYIEILEAIDALNDKYES